MNRGEFWIYWDGGKSGEASRDGWSKRSPKRCCTDTMSFPLRLSAHASTPMAPWSSARNTARCTSCACSWPKRAGDSSKFPLYQEVVLKPSTQFLSTLGHKLAGFGGKTSFNHLKAVGMVKKGLPDTQLTTESPVGTVNPRESLFYFDIWRPMAPWNRGPHNPVRP